MIDWFDVFYNGLWIFGCALALAAFSYTTWLANVRGAPLRRLLGEAIFQFPFAVGMGLVASGTFFLSRGWLEHLLWAFFTALFFWQAWNLGRRGQR